MSWPDWIGYLLVRGNSGKHTPQEQSLTNSHVQTPLPTPSTTLACISTSEMRTPHQQGHFFCHIGVPIREVPPPMLSLGGRLTKKCFCILKNRGLPLDWQSDKTTCECAELSVYSTPANSKTSRDGASVASYVAYVSVRNVYGVGWRSGRLHTHALTHTRVTSRPRPFIHTYTGAYKHLHNPNLSLEKHTEAFEWGSRCESGLT